MLGKKMEEGKLNVWLVNTFGSTPSCGVPNEPGLILLVLVVVIVMNGIEFT
jgi:hypothetical protein